MCIACENTKYEFLCPVCQSVMAELIRLRKKAVKQTDGHKLVRMADGSRKWLTNGEAEPLLKLPRAERK